jgi:hypothetical protein
LGGGEGCTLRQIPIAENIVRQVAGAVPGLCGGVQLVTRLGIERRCGVAAQRSREMRDGGIGCIIEPRRIDLGGAMPEPAMHLAALLEPGGGGLWPVGLRWD